MRRRAYQALLPENIYWNYTSLSDKDRQAVRWDVERCDMGNKEVLIDVIEQSCRFYYQGYHQIAKTILRIFQNDADITIYILRRLYVMHLGQFVANDDLPLVRLVQLMGPPMLCAIDYELYQVIEEYSFSVSWILTWFSTSDQAPRLIDALVSSHTLFPLYMSFALLIQHRSLILEDPMCAHKPLPIPNADALVGMAVDLMARIPPNQRLWLVTSRYYGDGAVEELLTTVASNSLLRLATPESIDQLSSPSSPRASIAAGMGRPKPPRSKRLLVWCVALVASMFWALQQLTHFLSQDPESPPRLVNEGIDE